MEKIPAQHRRSPASTLVGGFFSLASREVLGANVGDTLAFLYREGQLSRLFCPQEEDGIITYALGLDIRDARSSAIDSLNSITLAPSDTLLFASDGINALRDVQILEISQLPRARAVAEGLAEALIGIQGSGQDNATIAVGGFWPKRRPPSSLPLGASVGAGKPMP